MESTRDRPRLTAPLTAITAAAVGVMLSLAFFFGHHVAWPRGIDGPFDLQAAGLTAAAALLLVRWRRSVLEVLALCGLGGALLAAF